MADIIVNNFFLTAENMISTYIIINIIVQLIRIKKNYDKL